MNELLNAAIIEAEKEANEAERQRQAAILSANLANTKVMELRQARSVLVRHGLLPDPDPEFTRLLAEEEEIARRHGRRMHDGS